MLRKCNLLKSILLNQLKISLNKLEKEFVLKDIIKYLSNLRKHSINIAYNII